MGWPKGTPGGRGLLAWCLHTQAIPAIHTVWAGEIHTTFMLSC